MRPSRSGKRISRSATPGPPARRKVSWYSSVGGISSSYAALLEHLHRRALQLAAAAGGLAGEVERAGRSDGELRGRAWGGKVTPARRDGASLRRRAASTSRTLRASWSAVNGFSSSAPAAASSPWRSTASGA